MKSIVLNGHVDGCYGVQATADGTWDHPWVLPEGHFLRRDRLGRKNKKASTEFLVFRCNDPDCPAQLAFFMTDVEKALGLVGGEG